MRRYQDEIPQILILVVFLFIGGFMLFYAYVNAKCTILAQYIVHAINSNNIYIEKGIHDILMMIVLAFILILAFKLLKKFGFFDNF